MARARNIKPALFKNEILGQTDPLVSLLFIGLWTLADRKGVLEDRPLRIKAELFPYRPEVNVDALLSVLSSEGFITRYTTATGERLLWVNKFQEHQHPHHTEADSGKPTPEESIGCVVTVTSPLDNRYTPADSLNTDSLKTDSLIPSRPKASLDAKGLTNDPEFPAFRESFWLNYPKRVDRASGAAMGKGNQQEAFRRAKKLLKQEGKDWAWLREVVEVYRDHPNLKSGFVQLAEVFLGEQGHWLECAERMQRLRELGPALDRLSGSGLPSLPPEPGDNRRETLPVLEAECSPGGGPEGPSLHMPDLRGQIH